MQIQVFSIPMEGDAEATEQLNSFLRSQKVLSIEKAAVAAGGRQYWSVCVEYLPRRGAEGPAARGTSKETVEKARIDYRELLTALQFARFSKLRVLRKELADSEGVPVYTLFTNAQLAELATKVPRTKDALAAIDGIGEAKVKKYGELLLDLMSRLPLSEGEHGADAGAQQTTQVDAASQAHGEKDEVETRVTVRSPRNPHHLRSGLALTARRFMDGVVSGGEAHVTRHSTTKSACACVPPRSRLSSSFPLPEERPWRPCCSRSRPGAPVR